MHENNQNIFYRLWVYQRERFPLVRFGIVTIVFGLSAICLSTLLRHAQQQPGLGVMLISVFCVFSLLFQLRISDEFKDNEVDTLYRPERPVPRGLISLKELAYVFSILWILQFGFVIIFCSQSFPYLAIVWIYLFLMWKEFFVSKWLTERPSIYLTSHMIIVPLIALLASSFDWAIQDFTPSKDLVWFYALSYCSWAVMEIGRKIYSPEQERTGVETYTALWGIKKATLSWMIAVLSVFLLAIILSFKLGFPTITAACLLPILFLALMIGIRFMKNKTPKLSKTIGLYSGLYIIITLIVISFLPTVLAK